MAKPGGIREVELADQVFSALAPTRRQILLSVHDRGERRYSANASLPADVLT